MAARVAPIGGIAAESMRQATRRAGQHVAQLLAKVRRSSRIGAARHMIAAEGLAAVGAMIARYRGGGRFASVADPQSRCETLNWPSVTRLGTANTPAAGMTSQLRQRAGKWPARPRTQPVLRPDRTVRSPPGPGRWPVFG